VSVERCWNGYHGCTMDLTKYDKRWQNM
jgi:hypothetical protein